MEETLDYRLVSDNPTGFRPRRCLHAAPVLVLAAVGFGFVVWTQLGGSEIPDDGHELLAKWKPKGGKGRVPAVKPTQPNNKDPCSALEGDCKEGTSIAHGKKCTPQCQVGTVAWPPFPLTCASGEFDHTFTCEIPDPIPFPGIKRGVGAANGKNQLQHVGMYNWNKSVGWWYSWNTNVVMNGCWQYPPTLDFQYRTNYVGGMLREYQVADFGWDSIYPKTQWILGWNEPFDKVDLKGRPKYISPEKAYDSLNDYEKVAKNIFGKTKKKVQLVSPAISAKNEGMAWAHEYFCMFGQCKQTGKIDKKAIRERLSYVAVHWYACTTHKLVEGLDEVYNAFGLPIWLTEFNCGSQRSKDAPYSEEGEKKMPPANEDLQLTYMKLALPILELHPHVVRYAWYSDETHSAASKFASLALDGKLTELGEYYNNYPDKPRPAKHSITFDCDALQEAKRR